MLTVPAVVYLRTCFLLQFRVFKPAASSMTRKGRGKSARKSAVSRSSKAGLQFPVSRIARYIKKGKYASRVGAGASVYLAAVLEYLSAGRGLIQGH